MTKLIVSILVGGIYENNVGYSNFYDRNNDGDAVANSTKTIFNAVEKHILQSNPPRLNPDYLAELPFNNIKGIKSAINVLRRSL
ncbi:MAG TPA: hypothetical protein VKZ84_04780 [Bacteriovoracaceae bacterium]|nr:hypothetical protein [Bacteriovoracaceae bacterium]